MSLLIMSQGTRRQEQVLGFGGQEKSNNLRRQGGCVKQCTAGVTFHVIPDSVADPRLILQATAHPERFILGAGILAGLSSLTLSIIEGVKLWDIGD